MMARSGCRFALLALLMCCCVRPPATPQPGQLEHDATDNGGLTCRTSLPLAVSTDVPNAGYVELTLEASRPWASALGYVVARPAGEDEMATLLVTNEPPPKDHPHRWASTASYCFGGRMVRVIEMYQPGDEAQDYYVLMHELGHALGVDQDGDEYGHSSDPASIMYPNVASVADDESGPDAESKPFPQWVRPRDGAAIRRAWLP